MSACEHVLTMLFSDFAAAVTRLDIKYSTWTSLSLSLWGQLDPVRWFTFVTKFKIEVLCGTRVKLLFLVSLCPLMFSLHRSTLNIISGLFITLREICWEKAKILRVHSIPFLVGTVHYSENVWNICQVLKAVVQNNQAPPVFFPWFRLVLYNIMNYKIC